LNLGLFSLIMVVGGMIHGAFFMWLAMRKNTKEGTPSASHNTGMQADSQICQNIVEDQLNYLVRIGLDFQDRDEKDSVRDNLYRIVAGKLQHA